MSAIAHSLRSRFFRQSAALRMCRSRASEFLMLSPPLRQQCPPTRRFGAAPSPPSPSPLRVLFFGTDEVSLPALVKLHTTALAGTMDATGRTISVDGMLVVCPSDVRKGRKRTLHPVPIKQYCIDHGIAFAHPPAPPPAPQAASSSSSSSSSTSACFSSSGGGSGEGDHDGDDDGWLPAGAGDFDVGMVVSFGYMIPESLLRRLPYGAINLHPSLLPRYRGAAPVPRCLLNGDAETGTSIIRVTANKFDSGDVLLQRRYSLAASPPPRRDADNGGGGTGNDSEEERGGAERGGDGGSETELGLMVASELLATLAERGAEDLLTVLLDLDRYLEEEARPQGPRADLPRHVRTARKVTPDMGALDWGSSSRRDIMRQYRGLNAKPGTFTFMPSKGGRNKKNKKKKNKASADTTLRVNILRLQEPPLGSSSSTHTAVDSAAASAGLQPGFEETQPLAPPPLHPGDAGRAVYWRAQDSLLIACTDGWLECTELLVQGKRTMSARDFHNGYMRGTESEGDGFRFLSAPDQTVV